MGAPVHVLQTGDEVNNIVRIAAVAVMDAMGREGKRSSEPACARQGGMSQERDGHCASRFFVM
jgi:hypothetical protein